MTITQVGDVRGYLGFVTIFSFLRVFLPLVIIGGYSFLSLYKGEDGIIYAMMTILVVLIAALLVAKHVFKLLLLKKRHNQIFEFARENRLTTLESPSIVDGIKTTETSLFTLQEKENARPAIKNRVWDGDKWVFFDFEYRIYRDTNYPTKRVLYSVMCYRLPRKLPHILFDSKSSRKKQFKSLYDQDQRHTLEGGFDDYFDTYFPPTYTIDSMAFISPEVIEALIEASDYDIEILDDRLYLFGPINSDAVKQIETMKKHAEKILDKLMPNIQNYRDERVQYSQGREFVSPLGQRLQKHNVYPWVFVILFGTIFLVILLRDFIITK